MCRGRGASAKPAPARQRLRGWLARAVTAVVVGYVGAAVLLTATAKRDLRDPVGYSSAFFDKSGKLLHLGLAPDQRYRVWVPLKSMSPRLVEATLILEDRWYYWHPGVNPVSLARAAWSTVVTRRAVLGASTITMQVARLRYRLRTRTPMGKLRQVYRALALEWLYSKDELLEAYLNLAPYGGNIEGVGAASEIYFQKRAHDLTVGEALLLAVLPQSPTARAPARSASPFASGGTQAARNRLLTRWLAAYPAQRAELDGIMLRRTLRKPADLPFKAPHFLATLAPGAPPGEVRTTLDLTLQDILERRLLAYVERKSGVGVHNAAAMLVDSRTMAVVGLVGSAGFLRKDIQGQVNGTRAKRSPGSTLKPFIYGLAIDQGLIHPQTLLKDAPTTFGEWRPENFDQTFAGPVKAHDALIRSRNVPAIQIAAQLRHPSLYDFLRQAGVAGLREERHYGLALVLGGAETTMEELVRLYAMLANGGSLKPLRRLAAEPQVAGVPLLSPEAAYLVLDMLKDNPRPNSGYERSWLRSDVDVAWKTGTSYSFRDAWALGVFGPYVLAVWIGNFDGESNPAFVGLDLAGPLFFEMVDALKAQGLPSVPVAGLPRVREVEVCALSGKIPGPFCSHRQLTKFIPGKSPIQVCDIHRPVAIDVRTGLRACAGFAGPVRQEVFEFWDSDFQRLFRQAGIPRRLPPPWHPSCAQGPKANLGLAPRITSPRQNVVYNVRLGAGDEGRLPLTAVTDADGGRVYWFVGNAFLGAAPPGKPLFWTPHPGEYVVQAVDSQGRAASGRVKVAAVE